MHPPGLAETDDFIDETLSRPLQIVYRDENLVAVFKPAGLIVHRSESTLPHEPVLLQCLRNQLDCRVYPVHRLDRPTAGLILFGLNPDAAAKMVDMFTNRRITKHYQALVSGLTPETGQVDTPIESPTKSSGPQEALTHYKRLAKYRTLENVGSEPMQLSLLEINPVTGRSHQIRRHLTYIGHPIIGDQRYGVTVNNELVYNQTQVYRMLLTSMRLDFRHPYTSELQSIVVGRGSEFDRALSGLDQIG